VLERLVSGRDLARLRGSRSQGAVGSLVGLAMGYFQQMRYIVLPQARIAIAPTVGFGVQIIKSTAVTSIIGFIELSKAGTVITNATFRPFTVFAIVGAFYFVLCWPLSKYSQSLERKYNAAHRH
jgi:polar amino acid transport system permease protein